MSKKSSLTEYHYPNGVLASTGKIVNSRPVGVWTFYDPDSQISHKIDYDTSEGYFYRGNTIEYGTYINHQREGLWKTIDTVTTEPISYKYYQNGELIR